MSILLKLQGPFLILSVVFFGQTLSIIYPRIEIHSWITNFESPNAESHTNFHSGTHSWTWESENLTHLLQTGLLTVTRQNEYLTYVVSEHIERLRVTCTAPYPVTWISPQDPYHQDSMYAYIFSITERRLVKNVRDPSTFSYVSTLEIYDSTGLATRNYTCKSLRNEPYVERHLYIYWEGDTYLVYAGEVLDIRTQDEETMVLPCKVTRPDVAVYLFKETPKGYEEVLQNSSIVFHPIYGFTLKLNELKDPYGRYECISEDDSDSDELDSLRLNVLRGIHSPGISSLIFNQSIHPNATIKFDPEKQQIYCCSNGAKPPNLRVVYCRNEMACLTKEHLLHKISSKAPKTDVNGSCSTYQAYPRESGILRCRGDGIDVFHHYFTGLQHLENETFLLYFNRDEAKSEDMMAISSSFEDYHLFSGQNFTAFCDVSDFYFIKGLHWAIIWKNNSIQFLNESLYNPSYNDELKNEPYQDFDTIDVTVDYDMYSIICYAPIWNSTSSWAKKELVLDVQESILPELHLIESVTWYLNDTNQHIECQAEGGKPKPFIKWRKDGNSIIRDQNIFINPVNHSSIVKFQTVTLQTAGNYTCIALNYAGNMTKTIIVYVEPRSSDGAPSDVNGSTSGIFTFFITVVISALLIGLGILIWKLQIQKKIIDHLTGVVFRDVTRQESDGSGGTIGNGTQQQHFPAFPSRS